MKFPVILCTTYPGEPARFAFATDEEEYRKLLDGIMAEDSTAAAFSLYEFVSLHNRVTRWEQSE